MASKNKKDSQHHGPIMGGVILVVLGVVFLLQSYLHIDVLDKLWPLILVAAGIVIIYDARK